MKLALLTLPLHSNYGGILQAYALQTVLERMGHKVVIVNLPIRKESRKIVFSTYLKRFVGKYFLFRQKPLRAWPTKNERNIINQFTNQFIKCNLAIIECKNISYLYDLTMKQKFDGYVVGSDQIWRLGYTPDIFTYFLDFLESVPLRKIAYAASFGIDNWELTEQQTLKCEKLIQKFHAISVREDSGVALCKKYLKSNATHVLDPTLLLRKEDYISLLPFKCKKISRPELMVYILDKNEFNKDIVAKIAKRRNLLINSVSAEAKFWNVGKAHLEKCIVPPLEKWIEGFIKADFVITDSFHGTVFAILFHKPFLSIINSTRGSTRFISLLKLLQLEDRIIKPSDKLDIQNIDCFIDYDKVETLLLKAKESSLHFLQCALMEN
ncbi:polysaccharide pyruvyl transferase family protein [Parabacteroides pacaensis]|uniref:polysaccharide pyruvyl transferase family protein n=1 Tax=Parabacteroides pacaensis TaxID=2086575 RepID=UPI000D10BE32|nr:polysaccharide pyruvyl transferase family protein [Parabacteroides pacaensis]